MASRLFLLLKIIPFLSLFLLSIVGVVAVESITKTDSAGFVDVPLVLVVVNNQLDDSVALSDYYSSIKGVESRVCSIDIDNMFNFDIDKDIVSVINGCVAKFSPDYILLSYGLPLVTIVDGESWSIDYLLYFNTHIPVTRIDAPTLDAAFSIIDSSMDLEAGFKKGSVTSKEVFDFLDNKYYLYPFLSSSDLFFSSFEKPFLSSDCVSDYRAFWCSSLSNETKLAGYSINNIDISSLSDSLLTMYYADAAYKYSLNQTNMIVIGDPLFSLRN